MLAGVGPALAHTGSVGVRSSSLLSSTLEKSEDVAADLVKEVSARRILSRYRRYASDSGRTCATVRESVLIPARFIRAA